MDTGCSPSSSGASPASLSAIATYHANFGNQMDDEHPQLSIGPADFQLNAPTAAATASTSPSIEAQTLFPPESAFNLPQELINKSASFATLKERV
jgi:hypothetical protein